jgi:hypothetical protein
VTRAAAVFTAVFLTLTAAALGLELWASFDDSGDTLAWTHLIVRYLPAWVTFPAIAVLIVWLPWHFWDHYRRKNASEGSGRV